MAASERAHEILSNKILHEYIRLEKVSGQTGHSPLHQDFEVFFSLAVRKNDYYLKQYDPTAVGNPHPESQLSLFIF